MTQRSLITKLMEVIDEDRAERRESAPPSEPKTGWQRRWLPSRGNVLFTLVMIAVLLWAQSAGAVPFRAESAASTGTIAYQGRLADSSGNPLTQTLNMSFRLYSAATGGAALWTEQWTGPNGVQVSDGLFNVMLGSLTPIAQVVITGNSTLFLGITVGTDDEMSPRVQLGSVPFAVQALTVPDGSISPNKLNFSPVVTDENGNVSLGGNLAMHFKNIEGVFNATIFNATIGNVNGHGAKGYAQIHMPGDSVNTGNMFINWGTGRSLVFGGGKGSPQMSVDPDGNLWVRGELRASGAKPAIVETESYGTRKLYAVESPEVLFSDEGMGKLEVGTARIQLDPIFLETVESEFLVHLTPYSDALLYVSEVGDDYFVVTASQGDPNASFVWRLSATRKGYAGVRLEEVTNGN